MVVAYREAEVSDLSAVCVLGQVVNLLHHEAWPGIFAPPSDPAHDASHWEQSICKPNATTFVAEQAAKLLAFVTVFLVEDSNPLLQPARFSRIGSICVAQGHRGRGIGKHLMALAEQWAVSGGAGDIRLQVWCFNEPALALYKELGYQVRSHILGKSLTQHAA
jgi:ribosomal protein S18 acetylase RimI-like enzyme